MNIIELAKEAGIIVKSNKFNISGTAPEAIERFASLVRAEVEIELLNKLQKSEPKTQVKELNSFEHEDALVAIRIEFMRNH